MKRDTSDRLVVVSATCFADAQSAIELSAHLADAINAELKAYLIEDEAIYQSAAMPYSRVISVGNTLQSVSPEAMLAAFERDAEAYRQALEEAARNKTLRWTFEKRRGGLDLMVAGENESVALTVLGYQRLQKVSGEVILLTRATEQDSALVDLAASLSMSRKVPLHVALLPELSGEPVLLPENLDARLRQLAAKVSIISGRESLADFIGLVQRASPTAIIARNELANEIGIATLTNAGRCPLVLAMD